MADKEYSHFSNPPTTILYISPKLSSLQQHTSMLSPSSHYLVEWTPAPQLVRLVMSSPQRQYVEYARLEYPLFVECDCYYCQAESFQTPQLSQIVTCPPPQQHIPYTDSRTQSIEVKTRDQRKIFENRPRPIVPSMRGPVISSQMVRSRLITSNPSHHEPRMRPSFIPQHLRRGIGAPPPSKRTENQIAPSTSSPHLRSGNKKRRLLQPTQSAERGSQLEREEHIHSLYPPFTQNEISDDLSSPHLSESSLDAINYSRSSSTSVQDSFDLSFLDDFPGLPSSAGLFSEDSALNVSSPQLFAQPSGPFSN
jgi:hypothetical protein